MVLILAPIVIAMGYHGVWNLTETGRVWWENNLTGFNNEFRIFTGVLELVILIGLLVKPTRKYASLIGFLVMFLATLIQLKNGYSYKFGGFEVPLTYSFLFFYVYKNYSKRSIQRSYLINHPNKMLKSRH